MVALNNYSLTNYIFILHLSLSSLFSPKKVVFEIVLGNRICFQMKSYALKLFYKTDKREVVLLL